MTISLRDVLLDLVPDWRGGPLYVVDAGDVPGLGHAGSCLGASHPMMDLMLRDHVEWEGRGPCILLHGPAIAAYASAGDRDLEALLLSVALHEAAHALELGPPYFYDRPADLPPPPSVTALARKMADDSSPPGVPLWYGHGPTWARLCCHLTFRASMQGRTVWVDDVVGDSCAPAWFAALDGEPYHMADMTFASILETPPPARFARRWRQDTASHPTVGIAMIAEIVDRIRGSLHRRQTSLAVSYREMVEAVADGQELDADTAAEVLEAAGKSPDDLAADAAALVERRQTQARLATIPAKKARLAVLERSIEQAARKLAAAKEEFRRGVEPLRAEEKLLAAELADIEPLAGRLSASCPDPALLAERDALLRRRRELGSESLQLDARIRDLHDAQGAAAAEAALQPHARFTSDAEKITAERKAHVERLNARRAGLNARRAEVGRQIDALDAAEAELAARMAKA